MTKFDKLFYTGVLFITIPMFLLIIVIICSSNSRLNSNGKKIIVFDTVKVISPVINPLIKTDSVKVVKKTIKKIKIKQDSIPKLITDTTINSIRSNNLDSVLIK
jgi:uncharacterized protein YcfL